MSHKIRVLLTSIDAGGGHLSLKQNFLRTLQDDTDLEIFDYHSPTRVYDFFYKAMIKYAPSVWNYLFEKESSKLQALFTKKLAIIPERRYLRKAIKETKPDIIITTHFIQAIMLMEEKRKTKANYKVVSCIYDYGAQKAQFHLHTPAEYYLVRDEKSKLQSLGYVNADRLFIFGTTVSETFSETANLSKKELQNRFKQILEKYFSKIDDSKTNILFIGGSGWTRNSLDMIYELSASAAFNVFVSCGRDKELLDKLKKMPSVFAFGFVSQEELAIIEASVDLAVMSSIAPATIYELAEINKYPLLVHRFIKPQEAPHIDLLSEWGIGIYEPDDNRMIALIKEYLDDQKKFEPMLENAKKIRSKESEKAKNNSAIVKELYSR